MILFVQVRKVDFQKNERKKRKKGKAGTGSNETERDVETRCNRVLGAPGYSR